MAGKETENVGELGRVLSKLSMKSIPTWDASNRNEKTILSHLKSFENAIGGADLDEEEKARELIASLRGQALTLVDNCPDDERKKYEDLKNLLIEVFHKEKPIQILIQEFYGMVWRKKTQTIRQYATALSLTWKKIAKDHKKDDKTSDAILKNRLMDGLSAAEPKFGEWLQFTTSPETDFNKLAVEAENKYDVFKSNRERVLENNWEEEASFFNDERPESESNEKKSKKQKKENGRKNNRINHYDGQDQKNFFQGQRQEYYSIGHGNGHGNGYSNGYQGRRWESRPLNYRQNRGFGDQGPHNWRNDSYDRGFNQQYNGGYRQNDRAYGGQWQQGRRYGPPERNFYHQHNSFHRNNGNSGWRSNGERLQAFRNGNRPVHQESNWEQNQYHGRHQNNGNSSRNGEDQPRGTIAGQDREVKFLETTSKNL